MKRLLSFLLVGICLSPYALGGLTVTKVEPPNWWVGMNMSRIQLMVYGDDLLGVTVSTSSPHIKLLKVNPTANPSYAFIDIEIDPRAAAGNYTFKFENHGEAADVSFPVLPRNGPDGRYRGFDQSDVLYLITPDRFADGDTSNNLIAGMRDGYHPDSLIGRHGGDIQGIIDRLEYLKDLGISTLWLNPLVENDNDVSYHGYIATNLYKIDPRFGTNELYKSLVEKSHQQGLKVILDHVSNHVSINHPWIHNLPMSDWLNGSTKLHERTFHLKSTTYDTHSDSKTKANTTDGWFQDYMPDLNQRNKFVERYLIQNTLWWIESTGLDGIREDTYSYADQEFLARWAAAIRNEYPNFTIVGEVWVNDPVFIAPHQERSTLRTLDSHLPSVTDFGLFDALMKVFSKDRWDIRTIHETLAKDFLYSDPSNLVTFLDNHDVTRIMSICRGDTARFKMAVTFLLTARGIPQILYGTELGMMGEGDHGLIRSNFPGGFRSDSRDAFTSAGRNEQEKKLFSFIRRLLTIRKEHPALQYGEYIHFPSFGNMYAYLRRSPSETILCVANNNSGDQFSPTGPLTDYLSGVRIVRNLITGREASPAELSTAKIPGNSIECYQLIY